MSAILKVENLNVTLQHRRVSKKLVEDDYDFTFTDFEIMQTADE